MTEFANINKEVSVSLDVPRHTVLVTLPSVSADVEGINVRLSMHTDSVLTLLCMLHTFPDLNHLRIEGRVLDNEQERALVRSTTYQFYLSSRMSRSALSLPTSLRMTPEIIAELVQSPFSPSSSQKDIGYKTGYFNAGDLVERWLSEGRPNDLLPIIGGVNEFHIGSDTLSPQRLSDIAASLNQAFVEQEQSVPQSSRAAITRPPGFTHYNIQTLFPDVKSNYKKIKTHFGDRDIINNLKKTY